MNYTLKNFATGREFKDNGWVLDDPLGEAPSLIRAVYDKRQISFGSADEGIYRFADWLPIRERLEGSAAPVTYKSENLAARLGLKNLYITLSGYYPERGAMMTTCSFKETEAYSVCGRIPKGESRVLVVSSAGNTARAFAKVCSENRIPLLLCVPEDNIGALWSERPINDCVKLAVVESGADYFDAIHLGNEIVAGSPKFYAEGGAKNVARRDGMATTMLSAVEAMGRIPDYYFQAVGSGTGAIAAWEANLRLIEDGRFGSNKAKLILSQNSPFVPMWSAWQQRSRILPDYGDHQARLYVDEISAKVLSNRRPPYSVAGGLYDALVDTDGLITQHSNDEISEAAKIFLDEEGIDIHPASAVALCSLMISARSNNALSDSYVMLNVTGCGEERFRCGRELCYLEPSVRFAIGASREEIVASVDGLWDLK